MARMLHVVCNAGEILVETGDHHVAESVEDRRQRQQRGVGALGEPTHGQVGDEQQAEQHAEERDDPRRDHGELAEAGQRVGAGGDDGRHDHERQLGGPAGPGDR